MFPSVFSGEGEDRESHPSRECKGGLKDGADTKGSCLVSPGQAGAPGWLWGSWISVSWGEGARMPWPKVTLLLQALTRRSQVFSPSSTTKGWMVLGQVLAGWSQDVPPPQRLAPGSSECPPPGRAACNSQLLASAWPSRRELYVPNFFLSIPISQKRKKSSVL